MPVRDVLLTHLELGRNDFHPKPSNRADVSFSHVDPPVPELNRFFYAAIGGRWYWLDRRSWTLNQWANHLANKDRIETWIISRAGVPAGYVELHRKTDESVEIDYLGLLDQFIGDRLGADLLTRACERAFAMGAAKVTLNTCDLDHPKALANYQARGFRVVRTEFKRRDVPTYPPGPWEGALP